MTRAVVEYYHPAIVPASRTLTIEMDEPSDYVHDAAIDLVPDDAVIERVEVVA